MAVSFERRDAPFVMTRDPRSLEPPHSRYSYPRREDSELSFDAYTPPRYNPRWPPTHTTSRRTDRVRHDLSSCHHHTVNTFSRCSTRFLSVPQHRASRLCIRGIGRDGRTPTSGVLLPILPQSDSRTSSGQLTASVPTPRLTTL